MVVTDGDMVILL